MEDKFQFATQSGCLFHVVLLQKRVLASVKTYYIHNTIKHKIQFHNTIQHKIQLRNTILKQIIKLHNTNQIENQISQHNQIT